MNKYMHIKALFESKGDPERAIQMSAYQRNQFKFYGLAAPKRRAIYKDFLKAEKQSKMIDWSFLNQCHQDEYREFQYLVRDYLIAQQKQLSYDDISKIWPYLKTKQWWDSIDGFDKIIGYIGLSDHRVDEMMLAWSRDEDFWIRRVAIDHQLGHKEKTNTDLLAQIIINNFGSEEFFINKAIGWSLRDYSKVNPEWVREFILSHRNKMHSLSIREASKYLS